ncbi:MAG: hypothetical protein COC19_06420, partial [SAR86 cluster bacterium]
LDPPELGPMNIKIHINNDQISLLFTSQHGVVREVLEQTAARLTQQLQEEGFTQVNVDVSDGQQQQDSSLADEQAEPEMLALEDDDFLTETNIGRLEQGNIDYFV